MKWFGLIFVIFLLVGMLLCASPIVYASDPPEGDANPPEGSADPPPQDNPDPPADPSIQVDIQIQGNSPEVNVEVEGDNPNLNLGVNGDNPQVWLNGRNINQPTVISYDRGGGMDYNWVRKRIEEAISPLYSWTSEYSAKVELAASGLAKVIVLAQDTDSKLKTETDATGKRLTDLEAGSANLDKRVGSLEAEDVAIKNYIAVREAAITSYYNRVLMIIIIAGAVLILGLGAGLVLLWRRI